MGMDGFLQATCIDTDLTNTPVHWQEALGSGGCLSGQSSRGVGLLTRDWAPCSGLPTLCGGVGAKGHLRIPAAEGLGTEVFLLLELFLQHLLPRSKVRVKGFRS